MWADCGPVSYWISVSFYSVSFYSVSFFPFLFRAFPFYPGAVAGDSVYVYNDVSRGRRESSQTDRQDKVVSSAVHRASVSTTRGMSILASFTITVSHLTHSEPRPTLHARSCLLANVMPV